MSKPTHDHTSNASAGQGGSYPCDRSSDHRPESGDQAPSVSPEVRHILFGPGDRSPEVRHVLFGPEVAVRLTIANLHRRGYAEPNDWCKPQPTGKLGEVMSVLIRRVPLN
jgi:hypothetical protein